MTPATNGNSTWIVIAAYNEERRLGQALARLCELYRYIVVVDDGSNDATSDVAAEFPVWRLRHVVNLGQGAALQTGIRFALAHGAEILVTFDADGQHDSDDVARLIAPIERGEVDVVLGSRFLGRTERMPWTRRWLLRLALGFTRVWSQIAVTDTHNGLRSFSRRFAEGLCITHNRMAHASQILDEIGRLKARYTEVPVVVRYSPETLAKGQSGWNALRIVGGLVLRRVIG
jgi:glycosyltransferase involved in cell wall biosynthesis